MAHRAAAVFDATKASSPLSVSAAHTALLLMDYQNLIIPAAGDAGSQIISTAKQMRDWALSRSIPVYHCLIDTKSGAKPITSSKLADRWSTYAEKIAAKPKLGDETSELSPPADSELEKTFTRRPGFISVLLSDGLGDELKRRKVRSLIVSGLSTSGCVLSTVRAANDDGYVVTVVEDACADPVPGMHKMLMEHALATTAHVTTAQELRNAWGNSVN